MKRKSPFKDIFSEIASRRSGSREKYLTIPQPEALPQTYLPVGPAKDYDLFTPVKKMDSAAELAEELNRVRDVSRQFLADHAPKITTKRTIKSIRRFDWRVETEDDRQDFTGVLNGSGVWEPVRIPHYGGPLGRKVSFYRTVFTLSGSRISGKALFVCFQGVDYKAEVYINGACVGNHEGFFAPFECDFTKYARPGDNILVVKVINDYVCMGSADDDSAPGGPETTYTGDKLYAATGPGYDDPLRGWHHCPPGMGMYQDVTVEIRNTAHIHDLFVRPVPEENRAEAWIEITNTRRDPEKVSVRLSLYGQNFQQKIFENREYTPSTVREIGYGDDLQEAKMLAAGKLNEDITLKMEGGLNYLRIPYAIEDMRLWEPSAPWLYQIQITLLNGKGRVIDTASQQFGMRSFRIDTDDPVRKGGFALNGKPVRLRGANTMGHLQQAVMKKDFDRLIDDILLAGICNINFLRLTQRPVQKEIYTYCDRLGMMTQTDLPLFGVLRRNQLIEAVKQAEEMERLIRPHACNILISYINEPFPNSNNAPHRHLDREGLQQFFTAADIAVRMQNPDRQIKYADGDYDPPAPGLPDRHCYTCWYNGMGVDIGRLHSGYWQPVPDGWYFGCGEFGAEALDPVGTMRKYYPREWLPQTKAEEKEWSPNNIIKAQTGDFHYMFYDTPETLRDWVQSSQKHQLDAAKMMTEAFRRENRMNTFALHLLIDAFPSGWMKAVMDVDRNPKPAYFAYRNALAPVLVNLRTDRRAFYSGEYISLECHICNDLPRALTGGTLRYYGTVDGRTLFSGNAAAETEPVRSRFHGFIRFTAPEVAARSELTVRCALFDENNAIVNDGGLTVQIFPETEDVSGKEVMLLGRRKGPAVSILSELSVPHRYYEAGDSMNGDKVIFIDEYAKYERKRLVIDKEVYSGATAVFTELEPGEYRVGESHIQVKPAAMNPLHFVSRKTGHPLVEGFQPDDFKYWYDDKTGYITPILYSTFTADDYIPILTSGNLNRENRWDTALAAAEKQYGTGRFYICQLRLPGKIRGNPTAALFLRRLLKIEG